MWQTTFLALAAGVWGMTGVETIARVRFEHYQNGKGIKRIARELGIARDTVRKVLRSGATEFSYKREVQSLPKLGAWVSVLAGILEMEAGLAKRERRSTQRLFEELRGRGQEFVAELAGRSDALLWLNRLFETLP